MAKSVKDRLITAAIGVASALIILLAKDCCDKQKAKDTAQSAQIENSNTATANDSSTQTVLQQINKNQGDVNIEQFRDKNIYSPLTPPAKSGKQKTEAKDLPVPTNSTSGAGSPINSTSGPNSPNYSTSGPNSPILTGPNGKVEYNLKTPAPELNDSDKENILSFIRLELKKNNAASTTPITIVLRMEHSENELSLASDIRLFLNEKGYKVLEGFTFAMLGEPCKDINVVYATTLNLLTITVCL